MVLSLVLGKIIIFHSARVPDPWAVKLQIFQASAADQHGLGGFLGAARLQMA